MYLGEKDKSLKDWDVTYPFDSYIENLKDSGCYYLSPEICKDIIITAGVSGIHTPKAIKKIRNQFNHIEGVVEDVIPALRYMHKDIISSYAGELSECLVEAAGMGKGVEIAIGYPKVLVLKVN